MKNQWQVNILAIIRCTYLASHDAHLFFVYIAIKAFISAEKLKQLVAYLLWRKERRRWDES